MPLPDFVIYALLAGIGIALIAGPLGALTVWHRMAYFSETMAHSGLLGVAIGLWLSLNLTVGILVSASLLALALFYLEKKQSLSTDTLLGILSHSLLALGLVCLYLFSNGQVDLTAYLLGDFLTVSLQDIITIWLVCGGVFALIFYYWQSMVLMALDEKLAQVEGINVRKLRLIMLLCMAVVIALSMKIVGVLLIAALIVIPAATSRKLSRSPEAMAILASVLGVCAVIAGLCLSYFWDLPVGPGIVLSSSLLFCVSLVLEKRALN